MKKRILLQVCCAPDATVAVERLAGEYEIGIYFYNPNIEPLQEYQLRLDEMIRLASEIGVRVHPSPYDPERWRAAVRGLEHEPEKGARCTVCFRLRLEETAKAAVALGYPFFGTVLTVSPHKDADLINALGREIGERCGVSYLASDFKKRGGFSRSIELSREHDLYRQNYCGCLFSKRERERRGSK